MLLRLKRPRDSQNASGSTRDIACARLSLSVRAPPSKIGCAEAPAPQASSNKSGTVFGSNGLWMRFGNVNQTSLLPLLSTFTIFDCIEDRMRLGHAKSSKLLLHGSRLSLSLARRRLAAPNHLRLSHARDGSLAWTSARTGFGRVPDSKPLLPCTRIPPPSSRTQPRFAAPRKQGKDCKT